MRNDVTPIEDLVDLDEKVIREREEHMNKIKNKSIRNVGNKGGMLEYEKMYNTDPRQNEPKIHMEHMPPRYNPEQHMYNEQFYSPTISFREERPRPNPKHIIEDYGNPNLTCLDVSNHVQGCPICSKLYQNDKSIYIAIISILVILCLILFKKVLDKNY